MVVSSLVEGLLEESEPSFEPSEPDPLDSVDSVEDELLEGLSSCSFSAFMSSKI